MDGFIIFFVAIGALVFLSVLLYFIPVNLWFQCILTGVRITLLQLVFMRWRRVPPAIIVNAMINSRKAGPGLKCRSAGGSLSGGRPCSKR